eukprot:3384857-Amphidinium_carterae.1
MKGRSWLVPPYRSIHSTLYRSGAWCAVSGLNVTISPSTLLGGSVRARLFRSGVSQADPQLKWPRCIPPSEIPLNWHFLRLPIRGNGKCERIFAVWEKSGGAISIKFALAHQAAEV